MPLAAGRRCRSGSRPTTAGSTTGSTATATRCPTSTSSASASSTSLAELVGQPGAPRGDQRPDAGWSWAEAVSSARPGWSGRCARCEDELGGRPADVRVHSSARRPGSVLASLLGAGVAVEDLVASQLGQPVDRAPAGRVLLRPRGGHRRRPAGPSPGRHRLRSGCWCATPASCATCRRPRCCRRSCPRDGGAWTASAPWCPTSYRRGGCRAGGDGWWRWTTTPGRGCRSGLPVCRTSTCRPR